MTDRTQLVRHLSKLAQLPLQEDSISKYASELGTIMDYMEQIKSLELHTVEETSRISAEENVLRVDVVQPSFTQEEALANAKNTSDGYFMVDAVIEKDD